MIAKRHIGAKIRIARPVDEDGVNIEGVLVDFVETSEGYLLFIEEGQCVVSRRIGLDEMVWWSYERERE